MRERCNVGYAAVALQRALQHGALGGAGTDTEAIAHIATFECGWATVTPDASQTVADTQQKHGLAQGGTSMVVEPPSVMAAMASVRYSQPATA